MASHLNELLRTEAAVKDDFHSAFFIPSDDKHFLPSLLMFPRLTSCEYHRYRLKVILFLKSSYSSNCPVKELNKFCPQAAVTTVAFSSV